jgi:hypothetical protein
VNPANESLAPPQGKSYADLHVHTPGSDGLCEVLDWSRQARKTELQLIAITDHDHIGTVRRWHEEHHGVADNVLPGVEITARGRIVHIGVLFPRAIPSELPASGTPLFDVMRWARSIEGAIVVLVHPLPGLWRIQLRRLARAGLLPDAIETHFPLAFWRTPAIEQAATRYNLAMLGATDAHMTPAQLGRYVTCFPGRSVEDLETAIHARTTHGVMRPITCRLPLSVYVLQSFFAWLLPHTGRPSIVRIRGRLLAAARARTGAESAVPVTQSQTWPAAGENVDHAP